MAKSIIFGYNGQDGFYLNTLLQKLGIESYCVSRSNAPIIGDVTNYEFVSSIIKKYKPDYIFNFAAISSVKHELLFENINIIENGNLNILESCKLFAPSARIFISGSALQFKNNEEPIDENFPFDPSSPYALARIQSVYASRYYRTKFELNTYVGYFFHHDSPLRSIHHVNQKIIQAVKCIKQKKQKELVIGNLNTKKEFNYAGDIVKAIWKLVNQSNISEAVLGNGIAFSLKDWVECCFALNNLNWQDYVIEDKEFKSEFNILVSNPKLIKSIGWKPDVTMLELAKMMMDYE